jgi:hypothetical protein
LACAAATAAFAADDVDGDDEDFGVLEGVVVLGDCLVGDLVVATVPLKGAFRVLGVDLGFVWTLVAVGVVVNSVVDGDCAEPLLCLLAREVVLGLVVGVVAFASVTLGAFGVVVGVFALVFVAGAAESSSANSGAGVITAGAALLSLVVGVVVVVALTVFAFVLEDVNLPVTALVGGVVAVVVLGVVGLDVDAACGVVVFVSSLASLELTFGALGVPFGVTVLGVVAVGATGVLLLLSLVLVVVVGAFAFVVVVLVGVLAFERAFELATGVLVLFLGLAVGVFAFVTAALLVVGEVILVVRVVVVVAFAVTLAAFDVAVGLFAFVVGVVVGVFALVVGVAVFSTLMAGEGVVVAFCFLTELFATGGLGVVFPFLGAGVGVVGLLSPCFCAASHRTSNA